MRSCVFCKRRYEKNSETTFHRFPKDLKERKAWLQNMKITNWTPKAYDYLCSLHFTDECFNKHFNRTTLKPGSIPTVFEGISTFPSSLSPSMSTSPPCPSTSASPPRPSKSMTSPRLSASTSLPNPSTIKSDSIGTISAKRKLCCDANITELSDKTKMEQERETNHHYDISSIPKKAKIEFGLLHDHQITPKSSEKDAKQTRRLKAKLKDISQLVRRLKLKVANMKSVINDLI